MDEFEYINKYLRPLDQLNIIGDDCAEIPGSRFVITKDIIIEKVHFLTNSCPFKLAKKLLRVNLSDIAAMGATPFGYMLGITLPRNITPQWWQDFSDGLKEDTEYFKLHLLGGDTTAHDGPIILSATLIGIRNEKLMTRSGATPGDIVYVSGTIGDSALGLLVHQGLITGHLQYLQDRYEMPEPRVALGQAISNFASSCIDISDGLIQDAEHICQLSNVGMELYSHQIPVSESAQSVLAEHEEKIFTGGDDYELLFTVPVRYTLEIENMSSMQQITKIGKVIEGTEVILKDKELNNITLKSKGFSHW